MPEPVRAAEGQTFPAALDPTSSQRWGRLAADCTTCGQALYRRAGSRFWIHRSTLLRYSSQHRPHLAWPALDPAPTDLGRAS